MKAVKELPPRRAGQIPLRIVYLLHLAEAGITLPPESLEQLLKQPALPFERPREKHIQKVDLKPALLGLKLNQQGNLLAEVKPSPNGSARPLELLSLLSGLPLQEVKRVRVTKLSMELQPAPELTQEQETERQLLLKRRSQQELEPESSETTQTAEIPETPLA